MKKGLRSEAIPSVEVIDDKALKEEIKKDYQKSLAWIPRKPKELMVTCNLSIKRT